MEDSSLFQSAAPKDKGEEWENSGMFVPLLLPFRGDIRDIGTLVK